MSRDRDFQRTNETAIDFARLRSLALVGELGVAAGDVNEAFGILQNAFGTQWLNDAAEDVPKGRALPFRRHPIGDLVSTAGVLQLSELIEVAGYLRDVASVQGVLEVIANLKTAAYRQTFFQLSFADMLAKSGAQLVRFEPPTEDGRLADIAAVIAGEAFHVECFRPTFRVIDPNEPVLLMQNVLDVCASAPIVISVAIDLSAELAAANRREIVGVVRRLVDDVVRRSSESSDIPTSLLTIPAGVVSVCRGLPVKAGSEPRFVAAPGFPRQNDRPRFFMRSGLVERNQVTGVHASYGEGVAGSHVAVWTREDEDEEPTASADEKLLKLARKLESKLSQTRADDSARLIAVDTAILRDVHALEAATVERVRGKLIHAHEGVRGLFLMKRDPTGDADRHHYLLRVLLPSTGPTMDSAFVSRFSRLPNVELV
jgi:hypothetical protein